YKSNYFYLGSSDVSTLAIASSEPSIGESLCSFSDLSSSDLSSRLCACLKASLVFQASKSSKVSHHIFTCNKSCSSISCIFQVSTLMKPFISCNAPPLVNIGANFSA